jgi:hypothetical protein
MREVVELLNFGYGEIDTKEMTIVRFDILPENDLNRLLEHGHWASTLPLRAGRRPWPPAHGAAARSEKKAAATQITRLAIVA